MARIDMAFTGGVSKARSRAANYQLARNWFPEIEEPDAGNRVSMYPTPGLKPYGFGGGGEIRSDGVKWNNAGYFVSGSDLIKIDSSGTFSTIGSLQTTSGRVSIARGRSMLMIVDGQDGWTWNDTTFAQITDLDFPANPTYCTWLKDYFVLVADDPINVDRWYISAVDDATSWNALDFSTAEAQPDAGLRPMTLQGLLYLFGDETVEVFYPSGNPDFPFDAYTNGVMDWGIDAPDSIGKTDNTLFWLATNREGNKMVLSTSGLQASPISNRDIEWQINQLTKTDDAQGFCYRDAGHAFYVLTFPSEALTLCFDLSSGLWHERSSWNVGRWRVGGHLFFNDVHIVGDYLTNQFYTLDNDTYTDNGEVIERVRRGVLKESSQRRIFWNRFEAVFDGGVGLQSGQGSDPKVMLRWSDDYGHTWSTEIWRSIGKVGNYGYRSTWNMLGSSYTRIYEIKITDPVNAVLLEAFADMDMAATT